MHIIDCLIGLFKPSNDAVFSTDYFNYKIEERVHYAIELAAQSSRNPPVTFSVVYIHNDLVDHLTERDLQGIPRIREIFKSYANTLIKSDSMSALERGGNILDARDACNDNLEKYSDRIIAAALLPDDHEHRSFDAERYVVVLPPFFQYLFRIQNISSQSYKVEKRDNGVTCIGTDFPLLVRRLCAILQTPHPTEKPAENEGHQD